MPSRRAGAFARRFPLDRRRRALDRNGPVLTLPDVSPLNYGEEPLRDSWAGDGIRDEYEIVLVAARGQTRISSEMKGMPAC
jgi:hypothetical protein